MTRAAIVPIFAPEVLAMPIAECGEPLADVRELPGLLLCDRYAEDPSCFFVVRQSVLERLRQAQQSLPRHCRLMLAEALRPLAAQQSLQDRVTRELALAHPGWSSEQLQAQTALYVAPVDVAPPHSTGGAVDITLADAAGRELPMGSPLNSIDPASHTAFEPADPEERDHRALLRAVMKRAGFQNYDPEWWHWSYGDRYWALRQGRSTAIYGAVERDAALAAQLRQFRAAT
jgi:zinc D-Ala-D-Ala dipeptidase